MIFFRVNKDGSGFANVTPFVWMLLIAWVSTVLFAGVLVLSCE